MNPLTCPRCGHDHGEGWEVTSNMIRRGECHHGRTQNGYRISLDCPCALLLPDALAYVAQERTTRALYALAATFEMHQDSGVGTNSIVRRADALVRDLS